MASIESVVKNAENPTLNRLKGKRHSENTVMFKDIVKNAFTVQDVDKQNRKTLQTIQYSTKGSNLLTGQSKENQLNGEKLMIKQTNKTVKIFTDSKTPSSASSPKTTLQDCSSTQTDDSLLEDLIDAKIQKTEIESLGRIRGDNLTSSLLLDDHQDINDHDVTEEDLVSESTSENYWKILAEKRRQALNDTLEENEMLHVQNASLREENEKLTEVASQAETMVSFLQSVVSQDDEQQAAEIDENEKPVTSPTKSPGKSPTKSTTKSPTKSMSIFKLLSPKNKAPSPIKKTKCSPSKQDEDDWLNIELEGDISLVKSTEVTSSTPEAVSKYK
ncbi:hypothetical protein LOTGIDRAFT_162559 [Lottia gigantea]|uniref:Geminin n=1 Tax=Lottia gigantea TaxID=225164 RepID=V4BUB7_LOTGI|nr:hypothetical protein LOTGIDRAFT_162559 [Lottia gigantea]ESO92639.1 hypothetical protein LOTGIDRAFT_162559 [Lottia gigantea]